MQPHALLVGAPPWGSQTGSLAPRHGLGDACDRPARHIWGRLPLSTEIPCPTVLAGCSAASSPRLKPALSHASARLLHRGLGSRHRADAGGSTSRAEIDLPSRRDPPAAAMTNSYTPRSILVTGGAGFIASHVATKLVLGHPEYKASRV